MPVRRTDDVIFPSFSLAMSQYWTSDMRLPSYKTSYLLRFHPYPRVKLSNRETMRTIDDRLSTQYDIAEDDETAELDPLIFICFSFNHLVARLSPHTQPDLQEEQHPNAMNPQEAIKVADAGDQPRVRRASLTTLIIDLAVLMARKLSLKTK